MPLKECFPISSLIDRANAAGTLSRILEAYVAQLIFLQILGVSGSLLTLRLNLEFGRRYTGFGVSEFISRSNSFLSPLHSWFCLIIWRFVFALYILSPLRMSTQPLFIIIKLLFSSQLFSALALGVLGYNTRHGYRLGGSLGSDTSRNCTRLSPHRSRFLCR